MTAISSKKNLRCQLMALPLVLFSAQAWAYSFGYEAKGESTRAIPTTAEIHKDSGEVDSSDAKLEFSFTELKGLGLVVIYNPKMNVKPWAPTSIKQFEMDLAATVTNQKMLCATLGYTQSVIEDMKTQNDGYTGRDLTAFIEKSRLDTDGQAVLSVQMKARSKQDERRNTQKTPVIKRVVCVR